MTEQHAAAAQEAEGQVQETAGTDTQDTTGQDPDGEKFDASYVKQLRDEAAATRRKLRDMEKAQEDAQAEKAAQERAKLDETERLKLEKEEAEGKITAAEERANQRIIRAESKIAAVEGGIRPERVNAVMRLVDLSEVEFNEEGDPDRKAIDAAVKAVATEYPEFTAQDAGKRRTAADASKQSKATPTREDVAKMSYAERVELYNRDPQLYEQLTN